jgi:hypothetical protein
MANAGFTGLKPSELQQSESQPSDQYLSDEAVFRVSFACRKPSTTSQQQRIERTFDDRVLQVFEVLR